MKHKKTYYYYKEKIKSVMFKIDCFKDFKDKTFLSYNNDTKKLYLNLDSFETKKNLNIFRKILKCDTVAC